MTSTTDLASQKTTRYRVLCVDDEPNILRALKRALFSLDIELICTESGEQALAIMTKHKIHVVISDMKMPGMSGAELLEKVAQQYPDTYRIVLTGFADIQTTIQAVNHGKIHRYLQKPWDNNELIHTINEGLEVLKLKDENLHLQQLIRAQNAKLRDVNADLEKTVQKRTRQIKIALNRIELRNKALEQVLFNVISINPDIDGKFAIEVSELTKRLATKLGCSDEEIELFTYASLIGEIGLLGLQPENYRPSFRQLTYTQQKGYLSQTHLAKMILTPAEHMQPVIDIIEYQFEHFNGSGLYHKVAKEIPLGARIHAISRDYWRYVSGRISEQKITPKEAKAEMKKFWNTHYDGEILDLLLKDHEIDKPKYIEDHITTAELKPGHKLGNHLYNSKHILLLPAGHVFTAQTIHKLKAYEQDHERNFEIVLAAPDAQEAPKET